MSGEWIHLGEMPLSARVRGEDGTESVEALRHPRDGEIVARVLRDWTGDRGSGAVVEVVAAHERDELVVGDRLLLSDRAPCGHCEICRRGHHTLCPDASRVVVPSFRRDLVLVPAWIARRGRVRLPAALSDDAAAAIGQHSWILRGLRRSDAPNPLRILVVGDDRPAAFLGAWLETCLPDARRVLWGRGAAAGYHAVSETLERTQDASLQPVDLILALRTDALACVESVAAPGCRVVLFDDVQRIDGGEMCRREISMVASRGAVAADIDSWRRYFEAFSQRWSGFAD